MCKWTQNKVFNNKSRFHFLKQREKEEFLLPGEISGAIKDTISFFEKINNQYPDSAQIRLYDSLPLDLYWRQDDILATGPYLYGKTSQLTITYEFRSGTDGFSYYEEYFENLWSDHRFCKNYK